MKKGMMMRKRDDDEKEGVNDEKGDERIGERDTGVEPASQAWEDSRVSR